MDIKYRIQIEVSCDQCDGQGEVPDPNGSLPIECLSCDGTGYQTAYISLGELKDLLDSGE
jgi:DnaJ-class molecular chaperone